MFGTIATDLGRAKWWAESAVEDAGHILFRFPNGASYKGRVLTNDSPREFAVEYFGSVAQFELADDGSGGTDLTLTDTGVPDEHFAEVNAGWVSVLMSLKAAVDHGADLRNHDPQRTWDQGFADN